MADSVQQVMKNTNAYSKAEYKYMKQRSDGRLPDRTKPATKRDHALHESHIFDSGQYNTRHDHDHAAEFVYDIGRFRKEGKDELADKLVSEFRKVMNKQLTKIGLKVCEAKGCKCG